MVAACRLQARYVVKRVLLLNADWTPLNFITDHRAILLLLKGRAEVIVNMDGEVSIWSGLEYTSPSMKINVPATVRLLQRVRSRQRMPRFRKKVLFNRDDWECAYCGTEVFWDTATIDHILPKSRGGPNSWKNCVTSCKPCNKTKANKTPEEAGMPLRVRPTMPNSLHFWDMSKCRSWHKDWNLLIQR